MAAHAPPLSQLGPWHPGAPVLLGARRSQAEPVFLGELRPKACPGSSLKGLQASWGWGTWGAFRSLCVLGCCCSDPMELEASQHEAHFLEIFRPMEGGAS